MADANKLNFNNVDDTKYAASRLAREARQVMGWSPSTRDITDEFVKASNLLGTGQLVKDEHFTLFESVGALEIMDPKMDTGCSVLGNASVFEEDPAQELTPNEIIWIMDELLCLEIAWLEDYPLSQTVFTSIHVDRILHPLNQSPYPFELRNHGAQQTLTNQVLHPYCLALLRCAGMVLELARSQGFYEEEDFVSHTFGRDLVPDLSSDDAMDRLEDAAVWIHENVAESRLRTALIARLSLRRIFIQSIFGQANGWALMVELLDGEIESTRTLAAAKPACFSAKVLRHLATSTPPRPPLVTSWASAKSRWQKLCNDVAAATHLTSQSIRRDPASLQRAMWIFADRQASTLPRSIIQDIMFVDGRIADDVSHFDLLLSDIRALVLPGDYLAEPTSFEIEAVNDPRHKGARVMEAFLSDVLNEYLNLYRRLSQNRARLRRQSTHSIKELDLMEHLGSKHDDELERFTLQDRHDTALGTQRTLRPLSSWTRYHKLKIMAETVLLGFETDIYLPDEMAHMYWYLTTLLVERRHVIEHIELFTTARSTSLRQAGNVQGIAKCSTALRWYQALLADIDVQTRLAAALQKLFAVLLHIGLITPLSRSFGQIELCHEARMKIYLGVADPPAPSSEDFRIARTLQRTVLDTISELEADVQQARTALGMLKQTPLEDIKCLETENEWKAEVKKLETTVVAIIVAATQLKRTLGTTEDTPATKLEVSIPEPGKRYHDWWIVPQIKQKR